MTILITGSTGLIGSTLAMHLLEQGERVIGIDNDTRKELFGQAASTRPIQAKLSKYKGYHHLPNDIAKITTRFPITHEKLTAIVHCAAQPSHDWAATNPRLDFDINVTGTFNMLEQLRLYHPKAVFVHLSTNKVYGDKPNRLSYVETESRYEPLNMMYEKGFSEDMLGIDNTLHSLFGCSKAAGDLYVQEYGKYFGLETCVLRGGCLTGSNHQGVPLHGFLSWLAKCVVSDTKYTVYGYKGKQVRDNIDARDVATAIQCMIEEPPPAGEVYNIGGGPDRSVSVLEAIRLFSEIANRSFTLESLKFAEPRIGDHQWWVTDMTKFRDQYPDWTYQKTLEETMTDMVISELMVA